MKLTLKRRKQEKKMRENIVFNKEIVDWKN